MVANSETISGKKRFLSGFPISPNNGPQAVHRLALSAPASRLGAIAHAFKQTRQPPNVDPTPAWPDVSNSRSHCTCVRYFARADPPILA
jgi:hypothetical protein